MISKLFWPNIKLIYFEEKKYTSEMKQTFTTKDIINNMRKLLGHKENQNYIICDIHGLIIQLNKIFNPGDIDITLLLMAIPLFNPEVLILGILSFLE